MEVIIIFSIVEMVLVLTIVPPSILRAIVTLLLFNRARTSTIQTFQRVRLF